MARLKPALLQLKITSEKLSLGSGKNNPYIVAAHEAISRTDDLLQASLSEIKDIGDLFAIYLQKTGGPLVGVEVKSSDYDTYGTCITKMGEFEIHDAETLELAEALNRFVSDVGTDFQALVNEFTGSWILNNVPGFGTLKKYVLSNLERGRNSFAAKVPHNISTYLDTFVAEEKQKLTDLSAQFDTFNFTEITIDPDTDAEKTAEKLGKLREAARRFDKEISSPLKEVQDNFNNHQKALVNRDPLAELETLLTGFKARVNAVENEIFNKKQVLKEWRKKEIEALETTSLPKLINNLESLKESLTLTEDLAVKAEELHKAKKPALFNNPFKKKKPQAPLPERQSAMQTLQQKEEAEQKVKAAVNELQTFLQEEQQDIDQSLEKLQANFAENSTQGTAFLLPLLTPLAQTKDLAKQLDQLVQSRQELLDKADGALKILRDSLEALQTKAQEYQDTCGALQSFAPQQAALDSVAAKIKTIEEGRLAYFKAVLTSDHKTFATNPMAKDLYATLEKMRAYGEGLKKKYADKGDVAVYLAKQLTLKANAYFCQDKAEITPETFESFKREFTQLLHTKDASMRKHFAAWKPILGNIALALTGIGLFILAGQLIHSKVSTGKAAFFGQYTQRELLQAKVEAAANKVKVDVVTPSTP